jgi:hypothetical protein
MTKFDYAKRDQDYWKSLEEVFKSENYSFSDILINFAAHVRRREIARLLAHYELFKKVQAVPGHIIELGVSKAGSLLAWAKFVETFSPCDRAKKVVGFDHFLGNQNFAAEDGPLRNDASNKVVGGFKASATAIQTLVKLSNDDNLIAGNERVSLVVGDLMDTIPYFLKENPGLKISLLHIDCDLYKPSKFALEQLEPLVTQNGMIIFDEYGLIPWEGETRASDEYFKKIGVKPNYEKLNFVPTPHAFCLKTW